MESQIENILQGFHDTKEIPRLEIQGNGRYIRVKEHYFSDIPKEEICAYVTKDVYNKKDEFNTEISAEVILFKKSDLIKIIENTLNSPDKQLSSEISGIKINDDYVLGDSNEDNLLTEGPGIRKENVNLTVYLDFKDGKISYSFNYPKHFDNRETVINDDDDW